MLFVAAPVSAHRFIVLALLLGGAGSLAGLWAGRMAARCAPAFQSAVHLRFPQISEEVFGNRPWAFPAVGVDRHGGIRWESFDPDVHHAVGQSADALLVMSPQVPQVAVVETVEVGFDVRACGTVDQPEQAPQFPAVSNPPTSAIFWNSSLICFMR